MNNKCIIPMHYHIAMDILLSSIIVHNKGMWIINLLYILVSVQYMRLIY